MIILALALMAVSLIVFLLMNRQKEAVWLTGLFVGFALINIGLMFYYSKMGGLTHNEQILFFLTTGVQRKIERSTVTLDTIARIFSFGRNIFTYFVLMFSLDLIGRLKGRWWLGLVAAVWPICNIILTDPICFRQQSYQVRASANFAANIYILVCLGFSLYLMAREYLGHNIRWVKIQLRYIILFVTNLIAYFAFFGRVNPISIFYSEDFDVFFTGLKLYRLRFSVTTWIIVILVFLFFIVVGVNALFQYAKVNLDENRDEFSMERQLSTANMGTRVFIHGMKNQLFAEKIILGQLDRQMAGENLELGAIRKNMEELNRINENMTSRIEALYKVFRSNAMTLTPCALSLVVEQALKKAHKKLGEIQCEVYPLKDATILADQDYLSEALYNIIINAADAIRDSQRADAGRIVITLKNDHRWCAIRVDDNGTGIERAKLKKIFEPFYTEKNTNYSWGVGLSYVKQIVKYHFGKLHVESEPGVGTTFIMAFPKYEVNKRSERRTS